MSVALKNSFTILMDDNLRPSALLTNENTLEMFQKIKEDDKQYLYCDYCSVELGRTLEFLYRILWDTENQIFMIAIYKITDKTSELITYIKDDDLELRFLAKRNYKPEEETKEFECKISE
jgi:hypothetical protein